MGRKVFLSFLGLGNYDEAVYEYRNKKSKKVKFVQLAEIEILSDKSNNFFDKIIIVGTEKSLNRHFESLKKGIEEILNTDIIKIQISEDMSRLGQWDWFEKILDVIDYKDRLTFDLTHGYRSIPIILSTAINFLQKSKNISLEHVFYGAYEKNKEIPPIIDMKEFYIINELADGVSRLVDNADVRKLANVISVSRIEILPELNNEEVIKSFENLTDSLRNIDVNNISKITNVAIESIKMIEKKASKVGKLLINLVIDKFISINSLSEIDTYNTEYFKIQIEIIKILIEHKLLMQAFTVMRELVGSIGMLSLSNNVKHSNKTGRNKRLQYAEIFINMIQFKENEWKFSDESRNRNKSEIERKNEILHFYKKLDKLGIVKKMREFVKEMTAIRNGFDHAWMSKRKIPDDVNKKSEIYLKSLEEIINFLINKRIIKE